MQISFSLLIWGLLFFCMPAVSADLPDIDVNKIDSIFSEWDKENSPGCAVGIYYNGELVFQNGYGIANLDYNEPITSETVFYIGSVSKQFTAAAIALLVDRGDLSLDDDVREFIPELPEYERPIRVSELIYHTSGLRDLYALMVIADIDVAGILTIDDKLDLIRRQTDLNFLPADEYIYSNSGYTLMTILVERVSGKTLREFTHENIFQPLGMNNTHFHDNRHEIIKNRALSYQPGGNNEFRLSYLANFEGVGPGGLYTTVGDMFIWDQNYYDNRIPNATNFYEIMHMKGVLTDGDTLNYAFGLQFSEYKGLQLIGHGGSFMGFRAHYDRVPEHSYSHAILCNLGTINPAGLSRKLLDINLRETIEHNLHEFTGTYQNEEFDVDCSIVIKDGELHIQDHTQMKGQLNFVDTDTFSRGGGELKFTRNEDGKINGFKVDMPRARNILFHKK